MPVCSSKVLSTGPAMRRGASTYTTTVPWPGTLTTSSGGSPAPCPQPHRTPAQARRRSVGGLRGVVMSEAGTLAARRPALQAGYRAAPGAGNALECPHEPGAGTVAHDRAGGAGRPGRGRPCTAPRRPEVHLPPCGCQLLLLEVRRLVQPPGLLLPPFPSDVLRVRRLRAGSQQPESQQGSFPLDQAPGRTITHRPLTRCPPWI